MKELKATVYGVGINDVEYEVCEYEYVIVDGMKKQKMVWCCPYYRTWKGMLLRCYSEAWHKKCPTYIGCSVSEDWKYLSKFKIWMEQQEWEGKELDKDLLLEGNKVYSAKTCVFVTRIVNMFTVERCAKRGEYKIGVSWNKEKVKFSSKCSNPFTKKLEHLGYFTSELEAHQAWLKRKLELATSLAAEQTDEIVAKALIERYTNYTNEEV